MSSGAANCDIIGIANFNAAWRVLDARLDERQRHRLQRNGKGLLAVRRLRIPGCLAKRHHHLRHHLHRRGRISKSVGHGGGDCRADACDGHDGGDYRHDLRLSTPSPTISAIGVEAPGNQGVVIGGPVSATR